MALVRRSQTVGLQTTTRSASCGLENVKLGIPQLEKSMDDEKLESATESAHCALINFDNAAKMIPGLGNHPVFRMARGQLVDALKLLGRDAE